MTEHYDNICSLCGRPVEVNTLYYCCPECHRRHKKIKQTQADKQGDKDAILNTGSIVSDVSNQEG